MSLTNAISGIALVGSIVIVGSSQSVTTTVLGTIAIAASASNVIGGFLLTDRMLRMFRRRR
jgi:H+-translocating NAD(P) transhydrogenase subunit alpha